MDQLSDVRSALFESIGAAAEDVAISYDGGGIVVSGSVDDPAMRARALDAVRAASGANVIDRLRVAPEWGEEVQPKQTEFGTEDAARNITSRDFDKID
jgi:hypothetical protein